MYKCYNSKINYENFKVYMHARQTQKTDKTYSLKYRAYELF